jgi:hypothetical protein
MPRRQRGGSGGVAPVIKIRGKWRSVANATSRPLYPLAKSPGTHCWLGLWTGVEKRPLLPTGVRTPNLPAHSRSCIDCAILTRCRCTWSVNLSHVSFSKDTNCLCQMALLTDFYIDPTFVVKRTSYESHLLFSASCYPVMHEGSFRK